jgi:hypothetical protein
MLSILPLVLATAGPPANATPVVEAAFQEAFRVAKEDLRLGNLRAPGLCLAIESGSDPQPETMGRLAASAGTTLFPYSQCLREELLIRIPGSLEGPVNLVAVDKVNWTSRRRAEVTVRFLGGLGVIVVTQGKRGWQAQRCCLGGLVGDTGTPQNKEMQRTKHGPSGASPLNSVFYGRQTAGP